MGWELIMLEVSVFMDISVYECQAGLLEIVLNSGSHNCGL